MRRVFLPARRAALLLLGLALALGFASGAASSQSAEPSEQHRVQPRITTVDAGVPREATAHKLPCTSGTEPPNFTLYSLGATFEGLPLEAVLRRCGKPMRVPGNSPTLPPTWRANYVSYIYGWCDPAAASTGDYSDHGCAPPLEIQVWPACERNVAMYEPADRPLLRQRRGVPSSGDGGRIELYPGHSTVIVHANDAGMAERAVASLLPVRGDYVPATGVPRLVDVPTLPAPPSTALTGALRCGS